MLKSILTFTVGFAFGFSNGVPFDFVDTSSSSFTEACDSVLQAPVEVRTDLCGHVTIPLEALAGMVNAGIMDWQKACMEKVTP